MDRRSYLAGLAAGTGWLAGCAGTPFVSPSGGGTGGPDEVDLPVPEDALEGRGTANGIPAIVDPVFADDWSGVQVPADARIAGPTTDIRLEPDDKVIGLERNGETRAYPLRVLNWHEVVNDRFGGPVLVSYCPLCRSGIVADRRVAGERTVFGVSGHLWRKNLVLFDRLTRTLWSQIAALAIRGARTGDRLELEPSRITTWDEWRSASPGTKVLRPPPESGTIVEGQARDYTRNPYEGYDEVRRIGVDDFSFDDERLHPKTRVLGITSGGEAIAYPMDAVEEAGVVNDTVGDLPVVVTIANGTIVGYVRRVGGRTLSFSMTGSGLLAADGSRWRPGTGAAIDGPHEDTRLGPATTEPPMFWFAWLKFHQESEVYGA